MARHSFSFRFTLPAVVLILTAVFSAQAKSDSCVNSLLRRFIEMNIPNKTRIRLILNLI